VFILVISFIVKKGIIMRKLKWLFIPFLMLTLLFGTLGVVSADDTVPPEEEAVTGKNPVIAFLASITGETVEQIETYQIDGYGLGNIAKAYYLLNFVTLGDGVVLPGDGSLLAIMEQGKLLGWGNLYKELGLHPGQKRGLGWLYKQDLTVNGEEIVDPVKPGKGNSDKNNPSENANNNKDKEKEKGNNDKGNENGNNGKGNGKGNNGQGHD
jgi:hypothetical protein